MSVTTPVNQAKDKAQDFANRAYTQVKETLQDAASATSNFASQATDKVKEYASEATDKVKEYAKVASDKVCEVSSEIPDFVRRHPMTSVLTMLGIGILIGRLLKR